MSASLTTSGCLDHAGQRDRPAVWGAPAFLPDRAFPAAYPIVMPTGPTFREKATAIDVLCCQEWRWGQRPSRHGHGLSRLDDAGIAASAVADHAPALFVASRKAMFVAESGACGKRIDNEATVPGGLRLVPSDARHAVLADDHERTLADGMLLDRSEPFDASTARCTVIETRATATERTKVVPSIQSGLHLSDSIATSPIQGGGGGGSAVCRPCAVRARPCIGYCGRRSGRERFTVTREGARDARVHQPDTRRGARRAGERPRYGQSAGTCLVRRARIHRSRVRAGTLFRARKTGIAGTAEVKALVSRAERTTCRTEFLNGSAVNRIGSGASIEIRQGNFERSLLS